MYFILILFVGYVYIGVYIGILWQNQLAEHVENNLPLPFTPNIAKFILDTCASLWLLVLPISLIISILNLIFRKA